MKNEELHEKIMNDMKFRKKCFEYGGVSWENFHISEGFENEPMTIALDTPNKDVFLLMDEEYNPVGIYRTDKNNQIGSTFSPVYYCRAIYDRVSIFYLLSSRDIVNLSNRIIVSSRNHGHSLFMVVNGQEVTSSEDVYIGLLAYIKFLGDKIKNYYQNLYKSELLGFDYPDVSTYIGAIINNIDACIYKCITENKIPRTTDILDCIGDNKEKIEEYNNILSEIIDLLLYERGYRINNVDKKTSLEHFTEGKVDFNEKIADLMKLLDVSNKIVDERFDEFSKGFGYEVVDLVELLSHGNKRKQIKF